MAGGFGFNNRRPMAAAWHYQGRVQHMNWQGTFECYWEDPDAQQSQRTVRRNPPELIWTVRGDARLFGLAAALKAQGFTVDVFQDEDTQSK